jgi:hypothetical protein
MYESAVLIVHVVAWRKLENRQNPRTTMPSKKAPPTLTPEQIAAKRAAAMARFGGGAPAAGGKAPAKPKPSSGDGEGGAPTPPPPPPDSAAMAGRKLD